MVLRAIGRNDAAERHAVLDRGIFVVGLSALSEREAVILLAVDYLGWNQRALAQRLGLGYESLRVTLFEARTVFSALARHAAGIEADDEERGRLTAYLAGELTGHERRMARRHLQNCKVCQGRMRCGSPVSCPPAARRARRSGGP